MSFGLFEVLLKRAGPEISLVNLSETEKIQIKNEENMIQLSSKLVFHTRTPFFFFFFYTSMVWAFTLVLRL